MRSRMWFGGAALMLVLSACGWPQPAFDAGGSNFNPAENTIHADTPLSPSWSKLDLKTGIDPPAFVVSGARLFAGRGKGIAAFDVATGARLWVQPPLVAL